MHCQIISDDLLKQLKDIRSLKISQKIRAKRQGFLAAIKSFFVKPSAADPFMKYGQRFTYDCEHKTKLPGKLVAEDQTIRFNDEVVRQAHENVRIVRQFYKEVLDRNAFDGKGGDIISSVHYDKDFNNAYFDGEQYVFGDGDKKLFIEFCRDLGVVCHEGQHGVTEFKIKGGLAYRNQSGAINESLSDIFGVTCVHWSNKQSNPKTANWLIGDICKGPDFPGAALRTMVPDVKAYSGDTQPSNMKDYKWSWSDNGGVHRNSKIGNVVFYRICQNINLPSYDKPIQIVYKSMEKLKSNSDYKAFAKALRETSVEFQAFDAVDKALRDTGL